MSKIFLLFLTPLLLALGACATPREDGAPRRETLSEASYRTDSCQSQVAGAERGGFFAWSAQTVCPDYGGEFYRYTGTSGGGMLGVPYSSPIVNGNQWFVRDQRNFEHRIN